MKQPGFSDSTYPSTAYPTLFYINLSTQLNTEPKTVSYTVNALLRIATSYRNYDYSKLRVTRIIA